MSRVPYKNWQAITYAKEWCDKKDNSCGVYLDGENKSDCAHFLAHCLAAGGIKVLNDDPGTKFCKHGLAVRNTTISKELGLRHRAAIGVTETANVVALIVSEETGEISFASKGKLYRNIDHSVMRSYLNKHINK